MSECVWVCGSLGVGVGVGVCVSPPCRLCLWLLQKRQPRRAT